MCGICGIYSTKGIQENDGLLLSRMCDVIAHRGPDEQGTYIDRYVALGNRRLSIIDLKGGTQPITNETETMWVIQNGEIYNYQELRNQLKEKGHSFRTCSDTETILHAYEEYGDECVNHLVGMFAFVIWDSLKQRLFAARDRLGQKPFFYTHHRGRLIFGSEIKAILQDHTIPRELCNEALHHYLTLQYVPDPVSIFKNISKLPPAHTLVCDASGLHIQRYWDVAYVPKLEINEEEAAEELYRLLENSVRRRLISEVPLGAFLSGGIDSSIIVGLMAKFTDRPIKTFSIGFTHESFNELPYARYVANKWKTEHHELIVDFDRVEDMLPKIVASFDEPFADSAALQTYYLAKMTRQYVTVALSGDGGDELFAGYPRYWLDPLVKPYAACPRFFTQSLVPSLAHLLPERTDIVIEANWITGLKRLAQVARTSPKASIIRWGSYFNESMKASLLLPEYQEKLDTSDLLAHDFDRCIADTFLDRSLYVDLMNYLPGDGLVKVDRMTMANSLEVRSPFLDHEFVEFVARLPVKWKIQGRNGKVLLKKVFSDFLPPTLIGRAKRGFAAPIETWIKGDLRPLVHDLLLSNNAQINTVLNRKDVVKFVTEHEQGKINHGRRIWTLLILESWFKHTYDV
jgi:asparagine synthase (glutamine-hydrolysing)